MIKTQGDIGMELIEEIRRQACLNGDRLAFISRAGELTYRELWEKSGRLAGYIEQKMGENKTPVMVYGHKHPLMLVCFLACVRSGRAYCPVDENTPADRITTIASQIGKPLVMNTSSCGGPDVLNDNNNDVVSLDEIIRETEKNDVCTTDVFCKGEDVFYIIITSGSTGKPKGVQITISNLNEHLRWAHTLGGGIQPGAVFLNQAPYSFDLSVMDLYLSLTTGGTIVAIDRDLQQDIAAMVRFIGQHNIDYWVSTPSFVVLCRGDPQFTQAAIPTLKAFLFCGETLPNETAKYLLDAFPRTKVINTYGPTETTVCVTQVEITREMTESANSLPVGIPDPSTMILIDSETDEIIITGRTVSPGYYKDPEKTAKAFMQINANGVRAYRTGDVGHWDEQGRLYCDGRLDHQIKLHGYRMELEDIEANIERLEGVIRAVVIPVYREGRIQSLTACIIRNEKLLSDDYEGRKKIRNGLKKLLPSYMIPKRIRFIAELPVTENGKLDRAKLILQEAKS